MKPGSVLQSLLTITPSSGSIEPNKDAKIELAWNKDKSLRCAAAPAVGFWAWVQLLPCRQPRSAKWV